MRTVHPDIGEVAISANIGEARQHLDRGNSEAQKAVTLLTGAIEQLNRAGTAPGALSSGSGNTTITAAVASLNAAKDQFNAGGTALQTAIADVEHYVATFA